MAALELLGSGVVVAWLALPVLLRAARPRVEQDPAGAYRRMLWALGLSAVCVSLPWLRAQLPRFTHSLTPVALSVQLLATPVGGQQFGAARGYAVSPFDLLGALWILACATAAMRWAVARFRLSRLLRSAYTPPEALQTILTGLAKRREMRAPRLLLSPDASAPFSIGAWAPHVVLPAHLADELEPEQLALVLQHELAHLARRDPLSHALARVCATLFAFHPSVPPLLRELTIAREASVDAEIAREDRHAYASLLVDLASRLRFGRNPAHVSMDDTALARRIALLTTRVAAPPAPSAVSLVLAASAIALLGLFAPHVFAEPARFHTGAHALDDPMAPHEAEVDECYELARTENPELVISTRATFEVDPATFHVTAADVPTPESEAFRRCIVKKAMTWSFPPPPFAPPPPRDLPPGAKAMVAVQLEREP